MRAGPGRAPSPGQSAARAGSREPGAASGGGGAGPGRRAAAPPNPAQAPIPAGQRARDPQSNPKPAFSGPAPLSFCPVSGSPCPPVSESLSLSPCPPTLVLCPSVSKTVPLCPPFSLPPCPPALYPVFVPYICPLVSVPFYWVTLPAPHHPLDSLLCPPVFLPSLSAPVLLLCPCLTVTSGSLSPICPIPLSLCPLSVIPVSLALSITYLPHSPLSPLSLSHCLPVPCLSASPFYPYILHPGLPHCHPSFLHLSIPPGPFRMPSLTQFLFRGTEG